MTAERAAYLTMMYKYRKNASQHRIYNEILEKLTFFCSEKVS